jgi:threonine synthase
VDRGCAESGQSPGKAPSATRESRPEGRGPRVAGHAEAICDGIARCHVDRGGAALHELPAKHPAVEQGAITLDLCRRYVDRYLLVSEEEIRDALRLVLDHHHTLIEGSAAVAVAGALKDRALRAGADAVIVLCGANIARETLKEIL